MPCEKTTARCDLEYWRKREDTPLCCIQHLEEIMRSVQQAFTAADLPYWLDYGSLLGAVRNGRIITWDTDLDIGMLATEVPKLTRVFQLLAPDYFIAVGGPRYWRINYSKTNLVHCDIWIFDLIEGGKLHCKSLGTKEDFEPGRVERFKTLPFVGVECPVPEDAEGMLELRYGEKWKIPLRRNWQKT